MALLVGAAPTSELTIGFTKLRNAKGLIRVCLTAVPNNFPACGNGAEAVTRSMEEFRRFRALSDQAGSEHMYVLATAAARDG